MLHHQVTKGTKIHQEEPDVFLALSGAMMVKLVNYAF